jgi:RNA polymerase sigma-70 factor, ECF subfamily
VFAEDVVQDAFMSVWRRAASFEPGRGRAEQWLLAIVHHRAIDALRGKTGRARHDPPLDLFERELTVEDPGQEVDRLLRHEEVRRWLATLPESQRQILELAYFQGHTQGEIAAQLDLPLGTVKARVRLALRKLRDLASASEGHTPHPDHTPPNLALDPTARGAP